MSQWYTRAIRLHLTKPQCLSLGRSLLLGLVGGTLFYWAQLPLPWMLGPLAANLLAALCNVSLFVPGTLREAALATMGLMLGGQVTPDLASRIVQWPVSILLLLAGVVVSTYGVMLWYRRCGFQPAQALFSSLPGGMAAMVVIADKLNVDPRGVAISQSLRVVLVLLLLPPLFWLHESSDEAIRPDDVVTHWNDYWLLLLLLVVIPLGRRLGLPAASIIGPMIISAVLSMQDIAHFQMPGWGLPIVLLILGSSIGARFKGVSVRQLFQYSRYGVVATLLSMSILAVFAELIHQAIQVPRDIALLALAPGGMGEMAVLAIALGMDPLFVTFHHMFRLVVLTFAAPFLAKWLLRKHEK